MSDDLPDYGITAADWRAIRRDERRWQRQCRWRAFKAIWFPPVVDDWQTKSRTDGVICYHDSRDEEWTIGAAFKATIGLIFARYWGDADEDRYRQKHDGLRPFGRSICFWDSRATYGGYDVMVCQLYPGCRISIFSDGEFLL